MIYNLRGTSGSGKTTVVRKLLEEYRAEPIMGKTPGSDKERIVAYQIGENLCVLGSYVNVCGGCDTFSWKGAANYIEEKARVLSEARYHVLLEGLVQTAGRKRWEGIDNDFPVTWVFLDTPLETCIDRVLSRNGGRVGVRNWENLRGTYNDCLDQIEHLKKIGGRRFVIMDHTRAYEQLVEMLQQEGALRAPQPQQL